MTKECLDEIMFKLCSAYGWDQDSKRAGGKAWVIQDRFASVDDRIVREAVNVIIDQEKSFPSISALAGEIENIERRKAGWRGGQEVDRELSEREQAMIANSERRRQEFYAPYREEWKARGERHKARKRDHTMPRPDWRDWE